MRSQGSACLLHRRQYSSIMRGFEVSLFFWNLQHNPFCASIGALQLCLSTAHFFNYSDFFLPSIEDICWLIPVDFVDLLLLYVVIFCCIAMIPIITIVYIFFKFKHITKFVILILRICW